MGKKDPNDAISVYRCGCGHTTTSAEAMDRHLDSAHLADEED